VTACPARRARTTGPRAPPRRAARRRLTPRAPAASQEKSYFALRLPHGWWLFGLDLALVDDIDMCQCQCGRPLRPRACWVSVLYTFETACGLCQ